MELGFGVLGGEDKWGTRKAINKERNVVGTWALE